MFRVDKEKIGGNIRSCSDEANEVNIKEEDDFGQPCCEGDECQLPEWAADDQ
jgi:hypothetical protein